MIDQIKYSSYSTLELIRRISIDKDILALNSFISSRKLLSVDGNRLLFPDYLQKLREKRFYPFIIISSDESKLEEKLDLTCDRTLYKFTIMKTHKGNLEGPFCDRQYETLYEQVVNQNKIELNAVSQLNQESRIELIFKRMVIRHIKYSWLEVCRQTNILYQRYKWNVAGGTIELKKPQYLDGRFFTKWLINNIQNPDPFGKNEKHRIQREIDNWFGKSTEIDYTKINYSQITVSNSDFEIDNYPEDFSALIANEKAENIDKLRPTIRALGAIKLKGLVKKILEGILYNENNDISIADEYRLSKSTYSRFAGRDWKKENNGKIPDLWKNIAHVVIKNPIIAELAIELGLKQIIDGIIKSSTKR